MELRGKRILVLGAGGMVGRAACRRLIAHKPAELVAASLRSEESDQLLAWLRSECEVDDGVVLRGTHGNLFVRGEYKDMPGLPMLDDPDIRRVLVRDITDPLSKEILEGSALYQLILDVRPDLLVDCVNSATAIAYKNIFEGARHLLELTTSDGEEDREELGAAVERHLTTLDVPQLIRHVQILAEALRHAGTEVYCKVGTSGTGGMGFNIPYTHSEERPSRSLLSKAALAGAQTHLLFLMARTPGGPVVKEIKPTAAIAWKAIRYGQITRRGQAVGLWDCPTEGGMPLGGGALDEAGATTWSRVEREGEPQNLESVYVDVGENGLFSRSEFEMLTTLGQMEFVTPEEIAHNLMLELRGVSTGREIVNALDGATLGPSYRAGVLRGVALQRMMELEREHSVDSVAFEQLGPPRLSKLLYEAQLLRQVCGSIQGIGERSAEELSAACVAELDRDDRLRRTMLSVGVPVLMPDGRRLLRGPEILIPSVSEQKLELNEERIERWTEDGWVDLRVSNLERWLERSRRILEEANTPSDPDQSSHTVRDLHYWTNEPKLNISRVVAWILEVEEGGFRMKD